MNTNETQKCNGCHQEKDVNEFTKRNSKWGLIPITKCKACVKIVRDKYKALNRKSLNALQTKKRLENLEENLARERAYRKAHPEQALWSTAKRRAKKRKIEFNLTIQDIIIPEFCPVFGSKISENNVASLDRVNATKGYTKENVRVISLRANVIKNCGTIEEHEKIIKYMKENSEISS